MNEAMKSPACYDLQIDAVWCAGVCSDCGAAFAAGDRIGMRPLASNKNAFATMCGACVDVEMNSRKMVVWRAERVAEATGSSAGDVLTAVYALVEKGMSSPEAFDLLMNVAGRPKVA